MKMQMKVDNIKLPVLLFAAFSLVLSYATDLRADDRPNIMIFLVDDMGLMDTSCPMLTDENGKPVVHPLNKVYRTPSMERLAAQGIRFSNFHAHTVCSPTRASIMTGQNSARHRSTNFIGGSNTKGAYGPKAWNYQGLTRQSVTLPRLLQQSGYHTIHIGKAHFGPQGSEGAEPLNLGFDVNVGGFHYGAPGSYLAEDGYGKIRGNKAKAVPHLDKYHGTETHLSEALTIEAKAAVDLAVEKKKPFFLYMSHYAVHSPFQVDPRFEKNYEGLKGKHMAFATLIEGMDKSLGDLMDHFEAKGIAENTLIIFLGDNGSDAPIGNANDIACSAPLRGKKGSLWEGGTRVPFIAAWGKQADSNWQRKLPIAINGIQKQMGTCYDLLPTITELASVKVPGDHTVDGKSLKTLFTGKSDDSRSQTFLSHFPHSHRSNYFTTYIEGDWRAVYRYPVPAKGAAKRGKGKKGNKKAPKAAAPAAKAAPKYALYNLKEDPTESKNLATQYPEKLASMIKAMANHFEQMNALPPEVNGKKLKIELVK